MASSRERLLSLYFQVWSRWQASWSVLRAGKCRTTMTYCHVCPSLFMCPNCYLGHTWKKPKSSFKHLVTGSLRQKLGFKVSLDLNIIHIVYNKLFNVKCPEVNEYFWILHYIAFPYPMYRNSLYVQLRSLYFGPHNAGFGWFTESVGETDFAFTPCSLLLPSMSKTLTLLLMNLCFCTTVCCYVYRFACIIHKY